MSSLCRWFTFGAVGLVLVTAAARPQCASGQPSESRWDSVIVCQDCEAPAGVYYDGENVLVLLSSTTKGIPDPLKRNRLFFFTGTTLLSVIDDTSDFFSYPVGISQHSGIQYFPTGEFSILTATHSGHGLVTSSSLLSTQLSQPLGAGWYFENPNTSFRLVKNNFNSHKADLYVSYDTGVNFTSKAHYEYQGDENIHATVFWDSLHIWNTIAVRLLTSDTTQQGYVQNSTDGGMTWTKHFPFGDAKDVYWYNTRFGQSGMVQGASPNTIYLLNNIFHQFRDDQSIVDIAYTSNGGASWQYDSTSTDAYEGLTRQLYNPAGSVLWTVLKGSKVVGYSPDNGRHWSYDSVTFRARPVSRMSWHDTNSGAAVTWNGSSVMLYVLRPAASSVAEPSKVGASSVNAYVEPVSHQLYALADDRFDGWVEVYDILGRRLWQSKVVLVPGNRTSVGVILTQIGPYLIRFRENDGQLHFSRVIAP